MHIIRNLIFIWVFGNAVCSKIGNFLYLIIFILGGVIAGSVHMVFDGRPVIGASGAISAILGVCFILYPWNDVKCLFFVIPVKIACFFIILWWFTLDLLFAFLLIKFAKVAYWEHVGGFIGGIIIILILLKLKLVKRDIYNTSFYESLW
jgi:membrane associated rhomboid family serine protease